MLRGRDLFCISLLKQIKELVSSRVQRTFWTKVTRFTHNGLQLLHRFDKIVEAQNFFPQLVRAVVKKKPGLFTVRLTIRVYPPPLMVRVS